MPQTPIETSLSAWLPNGRPFVPGVVNPDIQMATCAGPDAQGECPAIQAGRVPACQDATWVLESASGRSWPFRFRAPLRACPVTLLTGAPPVVTHST
jgi:hypothetical protein